MTTTIHHDPDAASPSTSQGLLNTQEVAEVAAVAAGGWVSAAVT